MQCRGRFDLVAQDELASTIQGSALLVANRVVPVSGSCIWFAGLRRMAPLLDVLGVRTGSYKTVVP